MKQKHKKIGRNPVMQAIAEDRPRYRTRKIRPKKGNKAKIPTYIPEIEE